MLLKDGSDKVPFTKTCVTSSIFW